VAWGQWRAPDDRCWFPLLFAFIPPVANEKYTSYTAIEILFPFLIRIFFSRKYTVYFRRVEVLLLISIAGEPKLRRSAIATAKQEGDISRKRDGSAGFNAIPAVVLSCV
jgi:hypothetical protein